MAEKVKARLCGLQIEHVRMDQKYWNFRDRINSMRGFPMDREEWHRTEQAWKLLWKLFCNSGGLWRSDADMELYRIIDWNMKRMAGVSLEDAVKWATPPPEVADMIRCVAGNPFLEKLEMKKDWLTPDVRRLVMACGGDEVEVDPLLVAALADALEEAGCDEERLVDHLRTGVHYRGCWIFRLIMESLKQEVLT